MKKFVRMQRTMKREADYQTSLDNVFACGDTDQYPTTTALKEDNQRHDQGYNRDQYNEKREHGG